MKFHKYYDYIGKDIESDETLIFYTPNETLVIDSSIKLRGNANLIFIAKKVITTKNSNISLDKENGVLLIFCNFINGGNITTGIIANGNKALEFLKKSSLVPEDLKFVYPAIHNLEKSLPNNANKNFSVLRNSSLIDKDLEAKNTLVLFSPGLKLIIDSTIELKDEADLIIIANEVSCTENSKIIFKGRGALLHFVNKFDLEGYLRIPLIENILEDNQALNYLRLTYTKKLSDIINLLFAAGKIIKTNHCSNDNKKKEKDILPLEQDQNETVDHSLRDQLLQPNMENSIMPLPLWQSSRVDHSLQDQVLQHNMENCIMPLPLWQSSRKGVNNSFLIMKRIKEASSVDNSEQEPEQQSSFTGKKLI